MRMINTLFFSKVPGIRGSEGMSEFKPNVKACSSRKCPELVWVRIKKVERRIYKIYGKMPTKLNECPKDVEAKALAEIQERDVL